jgi:hypothetical protein
MITCKSVIDEMVTDELIALREKRWRKKLPNSFKSFIKDNNGGIPTKEMIVKDKWVIERFLCIVPKISDSKNGNWDIDAVITKYDEFMVFDKDSLGYDLIPFAQLNHDSLLCLCYENEEPSVVIWQLEGSSEFNPRYIKIYDNFLVFLESY